MDRRAFLGSLAGLVAVPLAAKGQPGNIPRLCFLTFDPGTPQSSRFDPFFQGLRDLGYVDGQTISIDYLSAGASQAVGFPALTTECLRLKADIIVVTTTPAAQAAKPATATVPIVMHSLGDPMATGLVASLARPGGNVTGTTLMASGLAAKRLGLLKEIVPREGVESPELKPEIEARHKDQFEKIVPYNNKQLADEHIPCYRRMLDLFREKLWLVERSTRIHYPTLVEFVEVWNRRVAGSLPASVAERMGHGEENLESLYEDTERHRDQLQRILKAGGSIRASAHKGPVRKPVRNETQS